MVSMPDIFGYHVLSGCFVCLMHASQLVTLSPNDDASCCTSLEFCVDPLILISFFNLYAAEQFLSLQDLEEVSRSGISRLYHGKILSHSKVYFSSNATTQNIRSLTYRVKV
jgi:hypothetical protein